MSRDITKATIKLKGVSQMFSVGWRKKGKKINKLKKTIHDPLYAWHVLRRRYLKLSFSEKKKIFAHASEYRSDSENGEYAAAILKALKSQRSFENFKRNPAYREILEHFSKEQGQAYLNTIQSRNDGLLSVAGDTVFLSDYVGNPFKYQFEGFSSPLSPSTLRYVKVASDLLGLFGKGLEEVAEIGCGYGGQCLVNDKLLGQRSATLFDLPIVNKLIKRYLNSTLMDGAYRTTTINEEVECTYDLVISNFAFSELPAVLQKVYVRKVLANSKRGYLSMNSGIGGNRDVGKLSLDELRGLLPRFTVLEEDPVTGPFNYIIVWGHSEEFAKNYFGIKQI
jgi:hypothetical protein